MDAIVQGMEATLRLLLGSDTQSALKFSHLVTRHVARGGVGTGLAGHALTLTFSTDATTPGVLPSDRVVRRDHRRYYDPLGLPLRSARLHRRLIRVALPRRRQRRRVSRVPHLSLNACCSPYPGRTRCACCSGLVRFGRGLRREMIGSAPPLFLCRGCRFHFMLRPAFLLPP